MLLVLRYICVFMPKTLLFVLFTSFVTSDRSSRSVVLFSFYVSIFLFSIFLLRKKIVKKIDKKNVHKPFGGRNTRSESCLTTVTMQKIFPRMEEKP